MASSSEVIRNHAAFIWSVADLLRGDYKQSEYGRAARRFLAERDEARRLRLDAQELLALVVELYAELAKLRKEVSTLRAQRSD